MGACLYLLWVCRFYSIVDTDMYPTRPICLKTAYDLLWTSFQKGWHSKYVELQAHSLCVEQFELAGRDCLFFWVPGSWVASPLAHLSLSPAAPPLTFAYPSDAAALKPTLPGNPGWTEAVRLLSEPIPDSATQPLLDLCDSHSASLFFSILGVNLPTQCLSSNPLSLQSWSAEALC